MQTLFDENHRANSKLNRKLERGPVSRDEVQLQMGTNARLREEEREKRREEGGREGRAVNRRTHKSAEQGGATRGLCAFDDFAGCLP